MPPIYKIHPGLGIARVGNSPTEFCLSPEKPASLPTACDAQGNPLLSADGTTELTIDKFKDARGRIKRQAARFQVYVYDEQSPQGRPLQLGDRVEGGGNEGVLVDIQWQVYVANKKAAWYEFEQLEGEHGFASRHPRRNAGVTDSEARQRLIIDPGPQLVNCTTRRSAEFSRDNDLYAPTFPPALKPQSIDTLGEIKTDDRGRLIVLGGFGHSGSYLYDDFGQPRIDSYANNDGWFDDTSDGPVMARLVMFSDNVQRQRFIDVDYPAWVIAGYPAYVPEILDLVTVEDVLFDVAVRDFAYRTDLYGKPGTFDCPQQIDPRDTAALTHWKAGTLEWNPHYKPWFYRDIWPILFRPDEYSYLANVLSQSNFPHNQSKRGTFDPYQLGVPPMVNKRALRACHRECVAKNQSGVLFLEALDPVLTTISSEAEGTVRRTLRRFHEAVDGLIEGYRSQGRTFPQRDQYEAWLGKLRNAYPGSLGDLLFGDFKKGVKNALSEFAQAVYGAKGTQAARSMKAAKGTQVEVALDAYLRQWQAAFADESPTYQQCKIELVDRIETIVAELAKKATDRWRRDAGKADRVFGRWGQTLQGQYQQLMQDVSAYVDEFVFGRLLNKTVNALKQYRAGKMLEDCKRRCIRQCTYDPFRDYRRYLFDLLRQPGEENQFRLGGKPNKRTFNLPLMPLLCGDNPITNTLSSKFLRLTDYQLYLLRQWAKGLFCNEQLEGWGDPDPFNPYARWENKTGRDLDRGVLSNLLGGAFCPGAEVTWIIRNAAIYLEPFRLKADPAFYTFRQTAAQANATSGGVSDAAYLAYVSEPLSQDSDFDSGLQPGDLTKYMAVPWQADFNECSTQPINITYEQWNVLYPDSEGDSLLKREEQVWETMWWPAHRPLQTFEVTGMRDGSPVYQSLDWSRGIPGTNAGDLKMTTAWSQLGFVIRNPYEPAADLDQASPIDQQINKYISVERDEPEGT